MWGRRYAALFMYGPWSRYGVNAVVAALDPENIADIYLVEKRDAFIPILHRLAEKYDKVLVGVGFTTFQLADEEFLRWIIELNRSKPGNTLIYAGGSHASGDPLGTVTSLGFDAAVIGEAEKTVVELAREYFEGGDPAGVKGVFSIVDGEPFFPGRQEPINLDDYHPFPYWRRLYGPIEITRGCPYGCFYCQVSYLHGFTQRHRSPGRVALYAEIMAQGGLRDIRFITPNGLGYGLRGAERRPRLDALEELFEALRQRVVEKYGARLFYGTFPSEVRPEHLTWEAARLLKKYVANKNIILGAQSGSNRVLRLMRRGHTIEDVYEAVENALRAGFKPDVDFIIGLPGETEEDMKLSVEAMRKLVSMGARIHLHVFLPLPGTPYAYAPPGRMPAWVKKEVSKLIGRGGAYGQWMQQEKLAEKIAELRRRGIILPRRLKIRKPIDSS